MDMNCQEQWRAATGMDVASDWKVRIDSRRCRQEAVCEDCTPYPSDRIGEVPELQRSACCSTPTTNDPVLQVFKEFPHQTATARLRWLGEPRGAWPPAWPGSPDGRRSSPPRRLGRSAHGGSGCSSGPPATGCGCARARLCTGPASGGDPGENQLDGERCRTARPGCRVRRPGW